MVNPITENRFLPELVLDGRGIRLAPFLLERLKYDRDEVNVALGILVKVHLNI